MGKLPKITQSAWNKNMLNEDLEFQALHRKFDVFEKAGLTTEELSEFLKLDQRAMLSKLLRWAEAEEHGRLIVLPRKIGDHFSYVQRGKFASQIVEMKVVAYIIDNLGVFVWAADQNNQLKLCEPHEIRTPEEAEEELKRDSLTTCSLS